MREEIYTFSQYVDEGRPLNVPMTGRSWCDRSYQIRRNHCKMFTVVYVTAGEGTLEVEGRRYVLGPGDTFFLHKGRGHWYACTGENWEMIWAEIDGRLTDALMDVYLPDRPDVLRGLDIGDELQNVFDLAKNRHVAYEEMCRQAALELHRILMKETERGKDGGGEWVGEMKAYIDGHLHQPLRLEELAKELGYSKNHIINVFRQTYGVTPYVYYERQKMRMAGDLLRNSAMNVSEIAARLGYDSPQYFSKCFRKYFEVSPSGFRAGERQKNR